MNPHDQRLLLLKAGFDPIPCNGKVPPLEKWAERDITNPEEIRIWSSPGGFPNAGETGIRTKWTPAIDIDILDADVAGAVEELARETFEEHGLILVRIGLWPKRAILLRTDKPFKKLTRNFVPANGVYDLKKPPKIEILADGQQVIAFGIHPDTQQFYNWPRGEPGEIKRDELPNVSEADMVAFLDAAVKLLDERFGWKALAGRPAKGKKNTGGNGQSDWAWLFENILQGRELHDSIVALAAKMVATHANDGAIVNQIRGLMEASSAARDERWQARYDDIPRAVSSARRKYGPQPEDDDEPPPPPEPQANALAAVLKSVNKWLCLKDVTPVYVTLGTIAANLLPGDPVWLGLIAPPSSAKTELLNSISRLPFCHGAATLTVPALLSGTPKKEKAPGAKGGLLRKIGEFGIMVLKDFGSILSMRPDQKNEVLGALREIFDGAWTRHVGTEGGRELHWSGKMGLIFGCTEEYDAHYGIIGSLGDRFILYRLKPEYTGQLQKALEHRGKATKQMRDELAEAVATLFAAPLSEPDGMTNEEIERLDGVCGLAIHLRAHVGRHRHYRDIEAVHDPEGPARLGLCLERLFVGIIAIGLSRGEAMRIIENIALDSCPQNRREAFNLLSETPKSTREIAEDMNLPTNTARRVLEDITAQGLAVRTRKKAAAEADGSDEEELFDGKATVKKKKGGSSVDLWAVHPNWAAWSASSRA